jgi:predicted phage-related endonuclease
MLATETAVAPQSTRYSDDDLLDLLALPADLSGEPGEAEVAIELSEEEKQFREETQTSLGGTAMAAICGFSSYRNAWDVAAEHKGILPRFEGNERTQWGQLLEEPVMAEYGRRTGQTLERVRFARDPERPFLGAHPDRLVVGCKKGVEGKTVEFGREKWSDPGRPLRVPQDHYIQCQHYMGVFGYDEWDLVALFGLSKMRWYPLHRNERVVKALREKGEEFWRRYIEGPDLPPIEPSERAAAWLKGKYPAPTKDTLIEANPEQAEAIAHWLEAKGSRETFEAEEEKWKIRVQAAIGEATGIAAEGVSVTWKKNKDSIALVTDHEAIATALAEQLLKLQPEMKPLVDALTPRFTRNVITKVGPRVMRVVKKEH